MTEEEIRKHKEALLCIKIHALRLSQQAEEQFQWFDKNGFIDVGLLLDRWDYLSDHIQNLRAHVEPQQSEG
jgi:hypothetical protein